MTAGLGRSATRRKLRYAVALVAAGSLGLAVLIAVRSRSDDSVASKPVTTSPSVPTVTSQALSTPVCGFGASGALDRVTAVPGATTPIATTVVRKQIPDNDGSLVGYAVANGLLTAAYQTSSGNVTVTTWSLTGQQKSSATITGPGESSLSGLNNSLAVGPDGTTYLTTDSSAGPSVVFAVSSVGDVVWSVTAQSLGVQMFTAVFPWHDSNGHFAVGVSAKGTSVLIVSPAGKELQRASFAGYAFSPLSDGTLITTASDDTGASVRRYSSAGTLLLSIHAPKASTTSKTGSPYAVDYPYSAVLGPDGQLLVGADGVGLIELNPDGSWVGTAPDGDEESGVDFSLQAGLPIQQANGLYYFAVESATANAVDVVSMSSAQLRRWLRVPTKLTAADQPNQSVLGIGAGLSTPMLDNYFPPGKTPQASAVFDPWWSVLAPKYVLRYSIISPPTAGQQSVSAARTVAIPSRGGAVALALPAAQPGAYQIDANLVSKSTGAVTSSTCLNYSVGAAGDALDFSTLSGTADWGGPGPLRGVQLAIQLGLSSYRYALDFSATVPSVTSTPSVSNLDFNGLPTMTDNAKPFDEIRAASALAAAHGVAFIVQVAQGEDNAKQAVAAGSWGAWIAAIVSAFKANAPSATAWAPWNEPNNTGYDDGGVYARTVQKPFYDAVKSVEPGALVVGGNSLDVSPQWWRQVAAAGGCSTLDVVSIHPYTGYNRSWEEDGLVGSSGKLAALRSILQACGAGSKPLWDTESAWFADGPANFWAQGDMAARAALWMRAEGISNWTYFITEGGYGDTGTSYSLIQLNDYVKTGALALMNVNQLLAGRPAPQVLDTGIPSGYAMRFGPSGSSATSLLAAWTDEFSTTARLTSSSQDPVTVTRRDVSGAASSLLIPANGSITLALSGSPVYLSAPAGVSLNISAAEDFGPNLLLGGKTRASSTDKSTSAANVIAPNPSSDNVWASGALADGKPDLTPSITVTTGRTVTADRVLVSTPSIHCCTRGLRDFTVSVRKPDGSWTPVGRVNNQFFDRTALITFPAQPITGVRIDIPARSERGVEVVDVNYTGGVGGLHPTWLPLVSGGGQPAVVSDIAAFAPSP